MVSVPEYQGDIHTIGHISDVQKKRNNRPIVYHLPEYRSFEIDAGDMYFLWARTSSMYSHKRTFVSTPVCRKASAIEFSTNPMFSCEVEFAELFCDWLKD